jgi:hypothetical protein
MRLAMQARQAVWTAAYTAIARYVITQAVRAPQGPLAGSVRRDPLTGAETLALAGDTNGDDDTIEVVWPGLDETPAETIVEAISKADSTGKMPPVQTLKLLLAALGVRDADDIVAAATDEDGNWIDPTATAGSEAVRAWREGRGAAGAPYTDQ